MLGNFKASDVIDLYFSTRNGGVMTTLAGSPVISVYKSNSTTQSTSGVTLDVDFDNTTVGLNHIRVDTSADGTFYAEPNNFSIVVTAGTVGGVSIVGVVVENFNLGYGDAYRRLGAPAGASTAADIAAVKTDSAAIKVQTDKFVFTVANVVDSNALRVGGTTQTGRDLGASVLVSSGTGTGQLDVTSGVVKANATQWLGGTIPAVNVTGVPLVDLKYTLGTISPATAGSVRADSVTGAVGSVTGNVGGNVVGSVASVTAAVSTTSNIKKNQALAKFQFLMTDSTNHNPVAGKTVTCTRSIDGAAFAAGTLANVAEVSTAVGTYTVDFGAGDLNGNVIVLRATATGSDDTFERIVTVP